MADPSPIVCCIDFSPLQDRVTDEAVTLAKALGVELVLLHAARAEEPLTTAGVAPPGTHPLASADVPALTHRANAEAERLISPGVRARARVIVDEDPALGILDEVKRIEASHLVIGSHGHAMVFELLVGSFTNAILRKARIPVVVVPVSHAED